MEEWQDLSYQARSIIHCLLRSQGSDLGQAIAMLSADHGHVICAVGQPRWDGKPCRFCCRRSECPLGTWLTGGGKGEPPDLAWLIRDGDEVTPAFSLATLKPANTDASDRLACVADSLRSLVDEFWRLERSLKERSDVLATLGKVAKLAGQEVRTGEVEKVLDSQLRGWCSVMAWFALLRDGDESTLVVPTELREGSELAQIVGEGLAEMPVGRQKDLWEVPADDVLLQHVRKLLMLAEPQTEGTKLGKVFALPLLSENPRGTSGPSRMWVVVAAFAPDHSPPGHLFDRIRLLSQLALTAWDSARRAESIEENVQTVALSVPGFEELVGRSSSMGELRMAILRAAKSDRNVLLIGETGTGKSLIARLIHKHSPRAEFGTICRLVAEELKFGRSLWPSFYARGTGAAKVIETAKVIEREYGLVAASMLEISVDNADWIPQDTPELADVIALAELDFGISQKSQHIYRSILRMLYEQWRTDRLFNFHELDAATVGSQNLSSILFGTLPGHFTGVDGGPGLLPMCSHCGGTFFLDNVHHLGLDFQRILLNATDPHIENRVATRIGTARSDRVAVHLISAVTVEPSRLVDEGELLAELKRRLAAEIIRIPPLQDRIDDMHLLAAHFANRLKKQVAEDASEPLRWVNWTDRNVGELVNVVETACSLTDQAVVSRRDVERALGTHFGAERAGPSPVTGEEAMIRNALIQAKGNKSEAARRIGWSRQKLHRKMINYGIPSDFGR